MCSFVMLLLIGLFGTSQCFMFGDECTVYPIPLEGDSSIPIDKWPSHNGSETGEITVKESCRNGTIDWNYPRGSVIVHFPFGGSFSVCIVDALGGPELTAIDTSGRCYKVLPAISKAPICVDAINGKVDITFQAPKLQYYMAAVNYYANDSKGIRCS